MGPSELAVFLENCHIRHYEALTTVISQDTKAQTLFYLLEGELVVSRIGSQNHELILAYLYPGEFFGEMGLFEENHERSAWVRTKIPCTIAQLSYQRFHILIEKHPKILLALTKQLAFRLNITNHKVMNLAFLDTAGRIAYALLQLSHNPKAILTTQGKLIRTTRKELAHLAGCSRETAGKVLKLLEQQGMVRLMGRQILVYPHLRAL